jgi:hypothetical protein
MPYKFFHPGEQYENYEMKKKFLENASGQLCRCYPKMPLYPLIRDAGRAVPSGMRLEAEGGERGMGVLSSWRQI